MIKITLKDGSIKEFNDSISVLKVAESISDGLARVALAGMINDKVKDLNYIIENDCELSILTFNDEGGKNAFRHSSSHILAQAVKRLYPNTKLAIGPAIESGFYYDFDSDKAFAIEDLEIIEKEMSKIVKEDLPTERLELSREEAIKLMQEKGEVYKVELIEDLPEDENISFYKQGEFIDLCAGPHLASTGKIKAFKLLSVTGAYWRGSEKNKMLQRIYGTSFNRKSDLDEYINQLEESKKRDHNKLGRQLELFMTVDSIGQGLPLLMPKGAKVIQTLQRFVEDEEERRGYLLTKTPFMAKSDLYKISGHWDHYRDGMFTMGDEDKGEEVLALRPMTCPFQFMIYKSKPRSYRDLPIRYAETSPLFRNEASGEMHGLIRVRQFTISEGHLICTPEQVEEEFKGVLDLINYMMTLLGIEKDIWYRFSKWDPNNKDKYIDNPKAWEMTQEKMKNILDNIGMDYREAVGEAAFYGPKLDIQFRNVHGKEDTIITVQMDFSLPERFDMTYIDKDNQKKRPIVIHRTSVGCYERTLAMLIEKYAGSFPTWLAPVQVKLLPIADVHHDYVIELKRELEQRGIRVEADLRNEKVGYKIREAQLEKIPYMLVVGDKEIENKAVAVRTRRDSDVETKSINEFIEIIMDEIESKRI